MRKLLLGLGLSSLLALSFGAFPMTSAARCRPALGFALARVAGTEGAVAPGGTVLLTLTRVYDADQAVTLPVTSVSMRRGSRAPERVALRALSANLFAFEMPTTEGRYTISPGSLPIEVAVGAAAPATVTSAPALASPPLGTAHIGTGSTATALDLAATAPLGSLGVVLRWADGTWFVPNGERLIGPGRCTPGVAGYDVIETGDRVSARFVDGGGRLGTEVSFTAAVPDSDR